jgi:hypothetical protein
MTGAPHVETAGPREVEGLTSPARIEVLLRDGEQHVATVRIEDSHRAEYPHEARVASERIAAAYAPELSALLRSAA